MIYALLLVHGLAAVLLLGALTLLLVLIVWSDFVLGHILNNVKGLS